MEIRLGNRMKTEQTQKQLLSTQVLQSLQILQFTSTELADYISEEMKSNPLLEFGESDSPVHQMVEADRIINSQEDPVRFDESDSYNGKEINDYGGYDDYRENNADGFGRREEYGHASDQNEYRHANVGDEYGHEHARDRYDREGGCANSRDEYSSAGDYEEYSGYDAYGDYDDYYDYDDYGIDDFYSYENPYAEAYYGTYNGFETDGGIYDFGQTLDMTLEEYLFNQIDECDAPYMVKATAAYIIQTLDENGYMTCTPDEISSVLSIDDALVTQARELIWTFDPPGVAALDVRESMKLQLKAIGRDDIFYKNLIDDHLEDLARGKYYPVARKLGVSEEEVVNAAELIRSLEPKPGSRFSSIDSARYVIPDIKIEKSDGTFIINISEHSAPKLIIRKDYQNMMKDSAQDSDVTSFLIDRMSSAIWLIKSIERRKETIRRLVSFIVDIQHDFFEHGEKALKPLTMKEAAGKIGVNESTISRAVNGKYVQCVQGVYELKYFFSGGSSFTGVDGQTATAESLKALIKKLIEAEDSSKPLSDRNISDAIMIKGIKISRRTVAKYREEMGIPGSSQRRR